MDIHETIIFIHINVPRHIYIHMYKYINYGHINIAHTHITILLVH